MKAIAKTVLLLLLISFLATGCNDQVLDKPELIPEILDQTEKITNQAIQDKNIKLARQIWTKVSEYGLKAREAGREELAFELGELAASYAYLVEYLEQGDPQQLERFNMDFERALQKLREYSAEEADKG